MGIKRILQEWREKVDGTLTGPAIETDSATVNGTTTTDALEATEIISKSQQIDKNGNYQLTTASEITVAAGSQETIFNASVETYCLGGVLNSRFSNVEFVIDGNRYEGSDKTANAPVAQDQSGNLFTVADIPHIYAESSLKINVVNTGNNSEDVIGAKIRTYQP